MSIKDLSRNQNLDFLLGYLHFGLIIDINVDRSHSIGFEYHDSVPRQSDDNQYIISPQPPLFETPRSPLDLSTAWFASRLWLLD